ncbi:MAG: ribosome-associated translation inhibitor RaiA [Actinomycetes bacterium]
MDIVVRGRHTDVSDRFREHAAVKLAKVERYDGKCHRVDIEVSTEQNPRLADQAVRVEITCHGKGPIIRGEAAGVDKYAALDQAYSRLEERLRRAADKRADHGRRHVRPAVAREVGGPVNGSALPDEALLTETVTTSSVAGLEVHGEGPLVVREKVHAAVPMTLDQALYEMELVGHDFYLFVDRASGRPSVVYRRTGYDYGVIHLEVEPG